MSPGQLACILAYSRLKALAVNGAGHPADCGGRMLAEFGLTLAGSKRRKGISSLVKDLAVYEEIFFFLLVPSLVFNAPVDCKSVGIL